MFYDKFAHLCNSKGVSLSKAALEAGISKSLVTKWKNSNIEIPSPEVITKLSNYFNIPVSELLGEETKNATTTNARSTVTSVIYVRNICQKLNIPISQLEKDCGFANGYLNPKKLSKLPYDRAVIIAEYLKVSAADILGASKTENAPAESGKRIVTDDDIMFALWGDTDGVDKDDLDDVKRYAAFVRERKLKK